MKGWTYIICLTASLLAFSCTRTPDVGELLVPEIVSITSIPDIHTAHLISDLGSVPQGSIDVGFYLGQDKDNLRKFPAALDGKRFDLTVNDLNEGTVYWFQAYMTNGMNEIVSGVESFVTGNEPVISDPDNKEDPDNPDDPDNKDDADKTDDPDNSETEEPEPEDPEFLSFADPIIKEMCVTAFDYDNDGKISYVEAAAVRDLSYMKLTDRRFKSFDELKYFTKLTAIPERFFKSCTSLESITLPESVETISAEAFKNCTALHRINLPEKLTFIERLAFEGCRSLERVDISSIETLFRIDYAKDQPGYTMPLLQGVSVYHDGSPLNDLTVPESIQDIKDLALAGYENLKSIRIHGNVTHIGQQAFCGCISLEEADIHDDVSEFEECVFDGCVSLKEIVLPKAMYEVTESMFLNCTNLQKVTLQEGVTMIGHNSFEGCGSLNTVILKGTVPPAISKETFRYGTKFLVPEEAVETYRKAPYWSSHAANIIGF